MLKKAASGMGDFLAIPFNRYLMVALIIIGAAVYSFELQDRQQQVEEANLTLHFFYSPTCPHCAEQKIFNRQLLEEFPEIAIAEHNVEVPEEYRLLVIMAQDHGASLSVFGVPTTFVGNRMFVGFDSATGEKIRNATVDCLDWCEGEPRGDFASATELLKEFNVPVFGRMDISHLSLPALAAVLGLVDGFNPCAMWVLVYLIGLTMNLNSPRRMWFIVGTFLLASGILYFLFMTAWLNAFLMLGYVRMITLGIGLFALGAGIFSIKEYIETKGEMACKVEDEKGRKNLMKAMKEVVSAPLTLATIAGIVVLAFTINSIEFVCSAAIPAVFTQVLALSNLSALEHYSYILLYDFFFMFDDLIVFGIAVFAISSAAGQSYAKYCKMVGGAIMLILGLMLVFAPRLLA